MRPRVPRIVAPTFLGALAAALAPLAAASAGALAPASAVPLAAPARAADAVKVRALASIYADGKGAALRLPEGVASNGKSLLVVADTGNGRLLTYGLAGPAVTPRSEIALPQIPSPIRVQIDSRGDILALDGKLRRIARLGADGVFKGYVEPTGGSASDTMAPRSFAIDARDALYVLDVRSDRIVVLGPDGKVEREIGFPSRHAFLSDVAVDRKGIVYAIDSVLRQVLTAGKDARVLAPLGGGLVQDVLFPASLAVDERGWIYVADRNEGTLVVLGADGSIRSHQLGPGWREGFLRYPAQVSTDARGSLLIADRENNRVQIFSIAQ